jgi:hypothetical protein
MTDLDIGPELDASQAHPELAALPEMCWRPIVHDRMKDILPVNGEVFGVVYAGHAYYIAQETQDNEAGYGWYQYRYQDGHYISSGAPFNVTPRAWTQLRQYPKYTMAEWIDHNTPDAQLIEDLRAEVKALHTELDDTHRRITVLQEEGESRREDYNALCAKKEQVIAACIDSLQSIA